MLGKSSSFLEKISFLQIQAHRKSVRLNVNNITAQGSEVTAVGRVLPPAY
jgi:hypothetical protein